MLDPTAFYAWINILHFLTRGGPTLPKMEPTARHVGPMLAHFSLLCAFWAYVTLLAAFVVNFGWFLRVLGRSRVDFGRVREDPGSGESFGGPEALFFDVFSCTRACKRLRSTKTAHVRKTQIFIRFLLGVYITHMLRKCAKTDEKSVPGRCERNFPQRSCTHCV